MIKAVPKLPNPGQQRMIKALSAALSEAKAGDLRHVVIATLDEGTRNGFAIRSQGDASHLEELGLLVQMLIQGANSVQVGDFEDPEVDTDD